MADFTLPQRVGRLLDSARDGPAPLAAASRQAAMRLAQPMRVAVVGKIKAGKSTMMNALIGEPVLATGGVETTFNVSWLVHAPEPGVIVHYKDGRKPEPRSFADRDEVTKFAEGDHSELLAVRHVEIRHPAPMLRSLELIDTPGLESVYADDSENTRRFLNLHGAELTDRTFEEAAAADAVVYLFSHSLSSADAGVLEELQGSRLGRVSPLNAIAVLTKVDAYWPDAQNPLDAGASIANRLIAQFPHLRQLFHTLRPVCGLLALGAQSLGEEEFAILRQLAAMPTATTERLFADTRRLCEREFLDVPVPPADRKRVWEKLGRYGLWQACRLICRGCVTDLASLRAALLDASGVGTLRELLRNHFGNRAYLIKLIRVFDDLKEVCFRLRHPGGVDTARVAEFAAGIEEIEITEPAFAELRALSAYYSGDLLLPHDMAEQLLAATGEYGTTDTAKLQLSDGVSRAEIGHVATQRAQAWLHFMNDVTGRSPTELTACRAMVAAFTRIARV